MTDHDLLMRIDVKLEEVKSDQKELKGDFKNHLSHHFKYNIMAWSAAIGAIISLILLLCRG